jgi:6-phosphogluconolactonase
MTTKARALLSLLLVVLATMFLVNCSPYSCRVTFGASTCTPSGSGIGSGGGGGGGGGGGAASAFAFAVDQNGTMDGYTLNSSAGTFQFTPGYIAPTIPLNDPGVGMVIAQKQFVYAVFELENLVYGWSINSSTGALTALFTPMALSLNAPIVGFNQYNIATNPAGTLLFVSDTGANEILVYQIGSSGALTAVAGSPFSTPVQPGNLTTDGLGKYLYVTENGSGHTGLEVLAYSISTGANPGVLTVVPGSPFPFAMWQLQGDASGNYLVGTSGKTASFTGPDDDHLYVFRIQPSGANAGAISQVPGSPITTTYSPFNIAVQPASSGGEFVYSFSINDADTGYNPIEGFQLDTTTGALTKITGSPFSGVATGHWGQFDQSGAFLFVYSSAVSGGVASTQLGVVDVSSTGVLTQPISPATLTTPGYWAVTDPQ